MRITLITFLLFAVLFTACKSDVKKEPTNNAPVVAPLDNPVSGNSSLPRLVVDGEETLLSWVERRDTIAVLYYSRYHAGKWSAPEEIISGTDWFINWADYPAIASQNGNILTSFLQKSADGTYTYDVKLNLFSEGIWNKNFILHDDGTQSEHGFVSMQPYAGDSFMVTWLDGRETVNKGHGGGQMTIRGALVFPDGSVQYDTLLDERVCDCCNTATAIGSDDEIFVAYRDRSEDEIRDISLVKWQKEGGWSTPRTIGNDNWKIPGCPVNGPAMDIYENNLAVAWFTAASEEGTVKIAFSQDNGESFGAPFRIDNGNAAGRVDLVMLSEAEAAILWMEPQGEEEVIQLIKIDSKGNMGTPITISKTSAERSSGFPQLEKMGDELIVAWTVVGEHESHIETASINLGQL